MLVGGGGRKREDLFHQMNVLEDPGEISTVIHIIKEERDLARNSFDALVSTVNHSLSGYRRSN